MRMRQRSYQCIACGSSKIIEAPRLEITCGRLGAPMDRAHVPAFRLLSLLIRACAKETP